MKQTFNAAEARRYRQAGALFAAGILLVVGALVWLLTDAVSGGDGVPGAWLTVPGAAMVAAGLWLWNRTVKAALRRWREEGP